MNPVLKRVVAACISLNAPAVSSLERLKRRIAAESKNVSTLTEQLSAVRKKRRTFFGIERTALSPISNETQRLNKLLKGARAKQASLKTELHQLESQQQKAAREETSRHRHLIDLSVFSWRREDGWPSLAIYSLSSPRCVFEGIRHEGWNDSRFSYLSRPELPEAIWKQYHDITKKLSDMLREHWRSVTVSLSCRFHGVIPEPERKLIREAITIYGRRNIYIVAESPGWTLTKRKVPSMQSYECPLIVAWDGEFLRYVGDFDTTELEDKVFFT